MTPEQTLDWLAQQHWDQCREDRPIQDWIRKMKTQLPQQDRITALRQKTESHDVDCLCSDCNELDDLEEALPQQDTVGAIKQVLKGIDQTETESPDGWWETSVGAEFGARKLKYIIGLLSHKEST